MLNRIKLQQIYRMHKDKKERLYLGRVLDIDHGTFTPLVFTTTGGIGDNAWHVRTIISVALLRLAFNCVRQKIGTSSALKLLEVSSTTEILPRRLQEQRVWIRDIFIEFRIMERFFSAWLC